MDKFKELSVEDINKLDAEAQVKYFNELNAHKAVQLANLKNELQKNATDEIKSQIEALKLEIEISNKAQMQSLHDAMKAQGLAITKLLNNDGGRQSGNGVITDFINENINKGGFDKGSYSAKLQLKAAELMTTANIKPDGVGGFSPLWGNFVDGEIGHVPRAEPFILPLITSHTQAGAEKIYYTDRINQEGDAQFIEEGALKPLIDAEWQTSSDDIKEVAVRWKMTNRLILHAPSVVADFREHANELIESKIDAKLLSGDATVSPLEPNGIKTLASAFIVPTGLALFYVNANIYDAIMSMAAQVRAANFKGQLTAILNSVWTAKMAGFKNSAGDYSIPPFVTPDGKNVGEVKIVFDNEMPAADIAVGVLKKFHAVFAEQALYAEGYENDDFSKNLVSKRLETYVGTYIKSSDAGAIVYDQVATVLTAINAVPAV
jgi:hypothetical protein